MTAPTAAWHDPSIGPCAICRQPTCRYGPQGSPLCDPCADARQRDVTDPEGGLTTGHCVCGDYAESDSCECMPCADKAAGRAACPHRLDGILAGSVDNGRLYDGMCDLCFEAARDVRDCGLRVSEHTIGRAA